MVTALTSSPTVASSNDDISGSVFRSQPHNIEAEKAFLGAIFIDNRAFEKVADFLQPHHFFVPQNGGIFKACARLIERGQIADPVTLKTLFEQDEGLVDIGGAAYLADLAASAATVINAGEYGRISMTSTSSASSSPSARTSSTTPSVARLTRPPTNRSKRPNTGSSSWPPPENSKAAFGPSRIPCSTPLKWPRRPTSAKGA